MKIKFLTASFTKYFLTTCNIIVVSSLISVASFSASNSHLISDPLHNRNGNKEKASDLSKNGYHSLIFKNKVNHLNLSADISTVMITKGDRLEVQYKKIHQTNKRCNFDAQSIGGNLKVKVRQKNGKNQNMRCAINFNIILPKSASLDIEIKSGHLKIKKLTSHARVKFSYGKLISSAPLKSLDVTSGYLKAIIKNLRGECVLKSGSGHYEIEYNTLPLANQTYNILLKSGNLQGSIFLPESAKVKAQHFAPPLYASFNNQFGAFEGAENFIVNAVYAEGKVEIKKRSAEVNPARR